MARSRILTIAAGMAAALVAALLVLAFSLGSSGSSNARAAAPAAAAATTNVVTVSGSGKATGTPDTMGTSISVTAKDANPSAALASANKTMAAVQSTLSSHGVAPKDLKTSGLSVDPNYVYGDGAPKLDGYLATESLQVTFRTLATVGDIITAVTAAGGSQVSIGNISLDLQGNSSLIKAARKAAFDDAKAKAQQYAALAGRTLGGVVTVSENVDQPQPPVYAAGAAASASAAVPIAAGSQDVGVDVTVVWSLN